MAGVPFTDHHIEAFCYYLAYHTELRRGVKPREALYRIGDAHGKGTKHVRQRLRLLPFDYRLTWYSPLPSDLEKFHSLVA